MSDPFAANSKSQLLREAQIGLTMVALLLCLFVYVAYYRISGQGSEIPENVRSAPVAEAVWPYENAPRNSTAHEPQKLKTPNRPPAPPSENFTATLAIPAAHLEVDGERNKRAAVPIATHVEPELTIRGPVKSKTENRAGVSHASPVAKKTSQEPPEKQPSSEFAGLQNNPNSENPGSASQSKVVDDPFEDKVDPIAKPIQQIELQMGQIRNDIEGKTASINGADNSFSSDPVSDKSASEPKMDCPKPVVNPNAQSDLNGPDTNKESVGQNKLRSTASPIDPFGFDSDDQFEPELPRKSNAVVSKERPEKPDFSGDFHPAPSSFETTASYQENLSPSVPKPDLITSSQDFSRSASSDNSKIQLNTLGQPARKSADGNKKVNEGFAVYHVKPGDSFWTIAQDRYGDGRFFRALYLYNENNVDGFDELRSGIRIETPSRQVLIRLWPEHCPSEAQPVDAHDFAYYVTQEGDTLFEIAAQRLGQASRYLEILELNSVRLPHRVNHLTPLPAGIHVLLPAENSN